MSYSTPSIRIFWLSFVILLTGLLAGCTIESKTALIRGDKVALFKRDAYLAPINFKTGEFTKNVAQQTLRLTRKPYNRSVYDLYDKDEKLFASMSFHSIDGTNTLIGQVFHEGKMRGPVLYTLVERKGDQVHVLPLSVKKDDYDYLIQQNVDLDAGGKKITNTTSYTISSKEDLITLVNYTKFKNRIARLGDAVGATSYKILKDKKPVAAIAAEKNKGRCLELAGHSYDPDIGKYKGVEFTNKIDHKLAQGFCEKAIAEESSNKSIQYALVRIAYVQKRYDDVQRLLKPLLAKDFGPAHGMMATLYLHGIGVEKDVQKGVHHMRLGDKAGFVPTTYELGLLHKKGATGKTDLARALSYFEKAADKGHKRAAYEAGYAHYFAKGTLKNFTKSFAYMKKAAEAGDTHSEYFLGFMLQRGQGTVKNIDKAMVWLEKAAKKNHTSAEFELGRIYDTKQWGKLNYKKAFSWYQKAAAEKHPEAQYRLALLYGAGNGVKENTDEAIKWLEKSSTNGNKDAKALLATIKEKREKAKREKARRLAAAKAQRARLYGPTSGDIKKALERKLGVGLQTLDVMGQQCNNLKESQNPIAAMMCLMTLGGNLNSRTMGMGVGKVDLDKCHLMKSGNHICRYNATLRGDLPGGKNPWGGLITALGQIPNYKYAAFNKDSKGWYVVRIYEGCTFHGDGHVNCTYRR